MRAGTAVPAAAGWLGAAGLVPFVAGAAGLWLLDPPRHGAALELLCGYSAVILSFLGAIHWGLAMARPDEPPGRAMAASVLPALLGWFALSLPAPAALALFAAGFVGVYLLDLGAMANGRAPRWYRRLRAPLTVCVVASLAAALAALLARGAG